jgi:outer membrane receptor protein involved in Fe transport
MACKAMAFSAIAFSPALLAASLEEVIVEAQKKSETITETPISLQAITGDQFQKYASFNFQDLSRTTPGLTFDTGVTPDIHLRGVSTVTLAAVSLRTNIYLDGALISQPRVLFDAQYDVERFEVLKGAQGTLYGKSSPTGTINIRTKSPSLDEVDGYVSGSVAENATRNTQFGISLPIVEGELGVRLAAVYDENEATGQHNVWDGSDAHSRATGARAVILWEPTDAFSARISYHYREKENNPWYTRNGDGFRYYDDKVLLNYPDRDEVRDQLAIMELTYTLNDHMTLTSVTAYEDQEYENYQDIDGTATSLSPAILPDGNTRTTHIPLRPQVQQDLRLASEDNDFWDWQIGGYYARNATSTAVNDIGVQQGVPTNVYTTAVLRSEEFAAYTHNTFKLTDDLNLIAGLRYQQARSNFHEPTTGYIVNADGTQTPISSDFIQADGIPAEYNKQTFYPVTGTVKLQYFFDPDLMAYGTIDRAYRTGGANLNIRGNTPAEFAGIPSETANSVEFGIKGNFWDQRGRFSVAVYDQVYKDFQQDTQNIIVYDPIFNGTSNLDTSVVAAEKVEVRGVEADLSLLLLDNWDVNLGLTFVDSKFKDFKNNPCTPDDLSVLTEDNPYNACDLSGERLPLASRWSGNVSSNFSLPAFEGSDWYFNTLVVFQSDQVDKVTRDTLGGYATVDFFTGLRNADGRTWDVNLWLKNAFDRRVITRIFRPDVTDPATGGTFDMVTTNLPRQLGITGTYRF